jgi:hypothetical protein
LDKNECIAITVMEECAELQQAISKSLRFGLDKYNPLAPEASNVENLILEYYQLQAMMELYIREADLSKYCSEENIKQIKENKIAKFMKFQNYEERDGHIYDKV